MKKKSFRSSGGVAVAAFLALFAVPGAVFSQECPVGISAAWSKVYLGASGGSDSDGLPIKVAPWVEFTEDGFFERSMWGFQIFTNPSKASKRDNFYVYDLFQMGADDVGALAAFNTKQREETNNSLKVALVSHSKDETSFSGLPVKMNGELVWSLASSKGETDAAEFWKAHNLPNASIPHRGLTDFHPLNDYDVALTVLASSSEIGETYLECDQFGRLLNTKHVRISTVKQEKLLSFRGYIAVDAKIPALDDHLVTKMISSPIQLPNGEPIEWAVEGDAPVISR